MNEMKEGDLFYYRQVLRLTQGQAARLMGVSRLTWNRWEKSHVRAPRSVILSLELLTRLEEDQRKEVIGSILGE